MSAVAATALTSCSASRMPYSAWEGNWDEDQSLHPALTHARPARRAHPHSFFLNSLVRPGRAILPPRPHDVRAGACSGGHRMARSASPPGLVLDRREHAGKLARHGAKRDQPPPSIALVNGPSIAEALLT